MIQPRHSLLCLKPSTSTTTAVSIRRLLGDEQHPLRSLGANVPRRSSRAALHTSIRTFCARSERLEKFLRPICSVSSQLLAFSTIQRRLWTYPLGSRGPWLSRDLLSWGDLSHRPLGAAFARSDG